MLIASPLALSALASSFGASSRISSASASSMPLAVSLSFSASTWAAGRIEAELAGGQCEIEFAQHRHIALDADVGRAQREALVVEIDVVVAGEREIGGDHRLVNGELAVELHAAVRDVGDLAGGQIQRRERGGTAGLLVAVGQPDRP